MAKQDISSKVMLYHNDVFSDIINALVFEKYYIDEDKLKDVIPETAYEDLDGNLRSMERDLLKEYGDREGAIDKKHNFQRLKYPVDALDMLYAYTKDEHYLNIRNKIVKREQEGDVISMGDFFDQVERNKIIETAKKMYQGNKNVENAVYMIECGLDVSAEEAKEIFETEILDLAL